MNHYVYFIQQDRHANGPVKIGYSSDPENRCKSLQTANSRKLKICFSLPFDTESMAREAERTFHYLARKKHRHLEGEWFIIRGSWKRFVSQAMKIYDGNQSAK